MPKINQEEYEILQFLNNTKDWIVRNPDGQLWAVEGEKPWKAPFYETWEENDGQDTTKVDVNSFLFQFVQWEDESPYNIQELIEEYERESEEMEVKKDIEWLKEEIEEDINSWGGGNPDYFRGASDAYENVKDWLNQLDEPEVLSQEFIDKYKVDYDNWMPAVPIVHLQNLLVPKQEEVDQAYKDGYEIGKKRAFEKAGLDDKDKEPETVASVIADFYKSLERLKEVLGMEVEEIDNV